MDPTKRRGYRDLSHSADFERRGRMHYDRNWVKNIDNTTFQLDQFMYQGLCLTAVNDRAAVEPPTCSLSTPRVVLEKFLERSLKNER